MLVMSVSVELETDSRRIGGLLYDLTFVNVTIKDAQVVQCNISNKHGYNFTNAYINVYSECLLVLDDEVAQCHSAVMTRSHSSALLLQHYCSVLPEC